GLVQQLNEFLKIDSTLATVRRKSGSGCLDGISPTTGGYQLDNEFWFPGQSPELVERALLATFVAVLAPRKVEQVEPVQPVAALQVHRLAQIEVVVLFVGGHNEAQPFLEHFEILLKRRGGRIIRNAAKPITDNQFAPDELHRGVNAAAQHGQGCFDQLVETR